MSLYNGRVLAYSADTKDCTVLVPALQGTTPIIAQAYLNSPSDFDSVVTVTSGDRVLVFYDGGDLNSQAYWMVAGGAAGPAGPPGASGATGPAGAGIEIQGTIGYVGPPGGEVTGQENGDLWIDSNGDGWVWDDTLWENIGQIRGPAGDPGDLSLYLTIADAGTTYLSQGAAASTYLTQDDATALYYTQTHINDTFATKEEVGEYIDATELSNALLNYVGRVGGEANQMTGELWLDAIPPDTSPLAAVPRIYVDNHIGAVDPHPNMLVPLYERTTGNYVQNVTGTDNQILLSGSNGHGSNITFRLPQDIHQFATPSFHTLALTATDTVPLSVSNTTRITNLNAHYLDGEVAADFHEWSGLTGKPSPSFTVSMTGHINGTDTVEWTDLAGDFGVSIATTIAGGPGSNVDADTLDGYQGAYYQNADNLNAGTVPDARMSGSYTFDLTGSLTGNASTATSLETSRTIAGKTFDGTQNVTLSELSFGTHFVSGGTYDGSSARSLSLDSTAASTASTLVERDAQGDFSANVISAVSLASSVATGTAPLTVSSTTKVANLNVDLLDGNDSTYFAAQEELEALLGDLLYVGLYNAAAYRPIYRVVGSEDDIAIAGHFDYLGPPGGEIVGVEGETWADSASVGWTYLSTVWTDIGAVAIEPGAGSPKPGLPPETPFYRHAMYWVVSSSNTVDFLDADLSGRYDVDIDEPVPVASGDWVIAFDPNVSTNGTGIDLNLEDIVFQFIPFSSETFVKSQIQLHTEQADPHPASGYLTQDDTDGWYAVKDHDHDSDIEQYIAQHDQRITYSAASLAVTSGVMTLTVDSETTNVLPGTCASVQFESPALEAEYGGTYVALDSNGPVILLSVGSVPDIVTTPLWRSTVESDISTLDGAWIAGSEDLANQGTGGASLDMINTGADKVVGPGIWFGPETSTIGVSVNRMTLGAGFIPPVNSDFDYRIEVSWSPATGFPNRFMGGGVYSGWTTTGELWSTYHSLDAEDVISFPGTIATVAQIQAGLPDLVLGDVVQLRYAFTDATNTVEIFGRTVDVGAALSNDYGWVSLSSAVHAGQRFSEHHHFPSINNDTPNNLPFNGVVGGFRAVVDGIEMANITHADINTTDPGASSLVDEAGATWNIGREASGPTTTFVPDGQVAYINPDGGSSQLSVPDSAAFDVLATDDAVLMWTGRLGNNDGSWPTLAGFNDGVNSIFRIAQNGGGPYGIYGNVRGDDAVLHNAYATLTSYWDTYTVFLIADRASDQLKFRIYDKDGYFDGNDQALSVTAFTAASPFESLGETNATTLAVGWDKGVGVALSDAEMLSLADGLINTVPYAAATTTSEPHPYYMLTEDAQRAFAPFEHDHTDAINDALSSHTELVDPDTGALRDPHAQYLNADRGDNRYEAAGAVGQHEASASPHDGVYYTQEYINDNFDIAGAIDVHEQDGDPHNQYLTVARGQEHFLDKLHEGGPNGEEGRGHPDLYYKKQTVIDLIDDATPDWIIALDGAASARIFLGAQPGVELDGTILYVGPPGVEVTGQGEGDIWQDISATGWQWTSGAWVDIGEVHAASTAGPPTAEPGDLWVQTADINLQRPSAPTGFTIVGLSPYSLRLTWNGWPTTQDVTGLTLQHSSNGLAPWTTLVGAEAPAVDDILIDLTTVEGVAMTEDTTYHFRLSAQNAASTPNPAGGGDDGPGVGQEWGYFSENTNNANPPVISAGSMTVTAATPTTFTLNWTAPSWSDPGDPGERYEVTLDGSVVIPVSGTDTFHQFTGLSEVSTYAPKVRAVDRSGLRSLSWSEIATATTNAPPPAPASADVSLDASGTPILNASWGAYTPSIIDFRHYEVQVVYTATTAGEEQPDGLPSTTSTALSWVTPETYNGVGVKIRVRTVDSSYATSSWVESSPVTTPGEIQVPVTASEGTPSDRFRASWAQQSGVIPNLTGFELSLYANTSGGGSPVAQIDLAPDATTHLWTDLTYSGYYTARLRVKTSLGTQPGEGPFSNWVRMVADPVPGVSCSASGTSVTGTVSAPGTPPTYESINGYTLYLYRGSTYVGSATRTGAGSYTWSNLSYSTSYRIKAKATRSPKDGSFSGYSGYATTGPAPDTTPPATPTVGTLRPTTSYGRFQVSVTWPSDTASYVVQTSVDGQSWSLSYSGWSNSGTKQYYPGTLSAGQSMRVRAYCFDAAGNQSQIAYSSTYSLTASPTVILASQSNYWQGGRGTAGDYNYDGTWRPQQGWTGTSAKNAVGMYYYQDTIKNACAGKTVTRMELLLIRVAGVGSSGTVDTWVGTHNISSSPGKVSNTTFPVTGNHTDIGFLWPGTGYSFALPQTHIDQFVAGTRRGFCTYIAVGGYAYCQYTTPVEPGNGGAVAVHHLG